MQSAANIPANLHDLFLASPADLRFLLRAEEPRHDGLADAHRGALLVGERQRAPDLLSSFFFCNKIFSRKAKRDPPRK